MASMLPLISRYMHEFTKEELATMVVELNFEVVNKYRKIEKLKREKDNSESHSRIQS